LDFTLDQLLVHRVKVLPSSRPIKIRLVGSIGPMGNYNYKSLNTLKNVSTLDSEVQKKNDNSTLIQELSREKGTNNYCWHHQFLNE